MSKKIIIFLVVIGILSTTLAIFLFSRVAIAPKPVESNAANTQKSRPLTDTIKPITSQEVSQHNTKDDCWTIISGNVYDITSYVSKHPGGSVIQKACGIDGTMQFTTRMSGSGNTGSGTPHSSSAKRILEQFKLGPVSEQP